MVVRLSDARHLQWNLEDPERRTLLRQLLVIPQEPQTSEFVFTYHADGVSIAVDGIGSSCCICIPPGLLLIPPDTVDDSPYSYFSKSINCILRPQHPIPATGDLVEYFDFDRPLGTKEVIGKHHLGPSYREHCTWEALLLGGCFLLPYGRWASVADIEAVSQRVSLLEVAIPTRQTHLRTSAASFQQHALVNRMALHVRFLDPIQLQIGPGSLLAYPAQAFLRISSRMYHAVEDYPTA
ncbi:hypothetical protein CC1G_12811 [Coprinopsis cinerea okayama7|uniref:Uncharacterized protein n=1 Tax=Coprinopsis cinerea (strain Okayama-7 / 130 / ATCC MYA-4618 / FGSC 9003) TaxID=240176 RepID=A8P914_COPC7|nr:hypothetical protein CC1G_12811 [Coprinopsis cinerea okayama7\|eukprot:XP_001839676.1 hypothetical protein CC1G_12811 [Coprinopsis cinerea okayama7\